ncbi:MAG: DUF4019 domain-containing protein [Sedimentisphaerales bacterium]|nr:DUF4019 domain-containing protein [Sedimentisphaerales bacterium]
MSKANLLTVASLTISIIALIGCKNDKAVPDAQPNEPSVKQQQPAPQIETDPQAVEKALAAAEQWLALIDAGKYADSWDQAAGYFKTAVPKEAWLASLSKTRTPLGKNVSRKLRTKKFATSIPGAPDGEYVIIQYQAGFEKESVVIETITPMLDKDGNWRVSGYFVR